MKLTGERKIIAVLPIVTLIVTLSTTVLPTQAHNPNFEQEPLEASSATTQYSAFSAPPIEWNKTYGGAGHDFAYDVEVTGDGGYIMAGTTVGDFWLVKTDVSGTMQWNETYGGTSDDHAYDVELTGDGGYIIAGRTESFGVGVSDFWLVKTDVSGTMQWNETYGGTSDDHAYDVEPTVDGAYMIGGYTESFGSGLRDFWLVRLSAVGIHAHDVAVVGVTTSKTLIGQGFLLSLKANIQNQGNLTETFNVTAYYNWTNPIAMQTLTLRNGNYATITFTWNTITITKGVYAISAYVTPLLGETETTDNTWVGGTVVVTIPGDVNADRVVDVFDLVQVARFYGTSPVCYGGPSYKACNTDINCDGTIDIFDLVLVAVNYGSI